MWPPTSIGLLGQVGEGHRAQDALGLADDVVVEEQDVVGVALDGRLVHRAREAAGAAEVALLDQPQLAARGPRRRSAYSSCSVTFWVPWSMT